MWFVHLLGDVRRNGVRSVRVEGEKEWGSDDVVKLKGREKKKYSGSMKIRKSEEEVEMGRVKGVEEIQVK